MPDHVYAFTIGAMAKAAQVSTPTIRYYESIGLLPRPRRSEARQRVYARADLDRLVFVRRCRDLGFDIETVRGLLGLSVRSDRDCSEARGIVAQKLSGLRQQLAEMLALETQLSGFLALCDDRCCGGVARDCTIFEGIANDPVGCA